MAGVLEGTWHPAQAEHRPGGYPGGWLKSFVSMTTEWVQPWRKKEESAFL